MKVSYKTSCSDSKTDKCSIIKWTWTACEHTTVSREPQKLPLFAALQGGRCPSRPSPGSDAFICQTLLSKKNDHDNHRLVQKEAEKSDNRSYQTDYSTSKSNVNSR